MVRGTQREILRKRPKNNNKAWIKFSETILSILGHCWKKIICSSLPARLMEEFPASNLTTCNLTYWEISLVTIQILSGKQPIQVTRRSYSRLQIPSDTLNYIFPSNTFRPRTIISSTSPSQQKFAWRTDILRNRSIGCPWMVYYRSLALTCFGT